MNAEKISINNLKNLTNVSELELKPITVLLGQNNTGKSTVLDFFSLMKQSLNLDRNEPIIWQDDFLDYGDFKTSVNKHDTNNNIEFEIKGHIRDEVYNEKNALSIKIELEQNDKNNQSKIKKIIIQYLNDKVEINDEIKLNNKCVAVLNKQETKFKEKQLFNIDDYVFTENEYQKTLTEFVDLVNDYLYKLFNNTHHFKPLRENVKRFYEKTESTTNIQSLKDVANTIFSLNGKQKQEWENFSEEKIGFKIKVVENTKGLSIILEKNNENQNLVDMGLGEAQIVYVIFQLWKSSNEKSILLFEQPESYLHPNLQNKLAKIIADEKDKNKSIIIETHSKRFIDGLARLVCDKKISSKDINLVLFQNYNEELLTRQTDFDENGIINFFPLGFLY